MLLRAHHTVRRRRAGLGVSLIALLSLGLSASGHGADADPAADRAKTATPIKHVIVIIGENRTFDHVFATYVPKNGQSIKNLLSEGIVNADGSPGRISIERDNSSRRRSTANSRTNSSSASPTATRRPTRRCRCPASTSRPMRNRCRARRISSPMA